MREVLSKLPGCLLMEETMYVECGEMKLPGKDDDLVYKLLVLLPLLSRKYVVRRWCFREVVDAAEIGWSLAYHHGPNEVHKKNSKKKLKKSSMSISAPENNSKILLFNPRCPNKKKSHPEAKKFDAGVIRTHAPEGNGCLQLPK